MSHFPLDRLATALRAEGVEVDVLPGAQGRSARMFTNGYSRGCQAVVEHHTAGSGMYPDADIRYILNGKGEGYVISNAYTWRTKKKITLIASGPTYTEGSGGPYGLIPANGANSIAFSNEIANPGGEQDIYPPFQQEAIAAFAYHAGLIAAEVWGWADDPFGKYRAFSHFEWAPGRKIDPRGVSRWSPLGDMWDMDQFRAELRNRTSEDDYVITHPDPPDNRALDTRDLGARPSPGDRWVRPVNYAGKQEIGLKVQAVDAVGDGWIEINGRSALAFSKGRGDGFIPIPGTDELTVILRGASEAHVIVDVASVID